MPYFIGNIYDQGTIRLVRMEDEGKLIDGYLNYVIEGHNDGIHTYVNWKIFNREDQNIRKELEYVRLIESRIAQYDLAIPHKNQRGHTITGPGRDILRIGGYNKWRKIEDDKVSRQTKRENGIYIINKILAGTAILSLMFSLYQLYTNNQIDNKLKDLVRQDSIFNQKLKTIMLPVKILKKHKE